MTGGQVLYIGDTEEKFAFFDAATLAALGVVTEAHGKMPDLVVYFRERNWLVLIEAVTSHGPIDAKRRAELQVLFRCKCCFKAPARASCLSRLS